MSTAPHLAPGSDGPYYVIVDVDIRDVSRYLTYMEKVRPALEAAGGRYLARGGAYTVYEGGWQPARLVLIEFPSQTACRSTTERHTRALRRYGTRRAPPT